jgi:hypothetical protein
MFSKSSLQNVTGMRTKWQQTDGHAVSHPDNTEGDDHVRRYKSRLIPILSHDLARYAWGHVSACDVIWSVAFSWA